MCVWFCFCHVEIAFLQIDFVIFNGDASEDLKFSRFQHCGFRKVVCEMHVFIFFLSLMT